MENGSVITGSLIALSLLLQSAAPLRLFPVDDTSRDASFRSYAGRLRTAVARRDTQALRKLMYEDVLVGPGDKDKGWEKFVERWRPDNREYPLLWNVLTDLLSLGFAREHPNVFVSPYVVWRFPREIDAASHLVIVRDKVALRESPSPAAPVIAWLSFDIVRRLEASEDTAALVQWVRVRTFDGKEGWVVSRDAMSPLMPRAQFSRQNGRWLMVALER